MAEGAYGLAGQPEEFLRLAAAVQNALNIPYLNITRDYWLTACLHGIARAAHPDGLIYKGEGRDRTPLAKCAFAGGTSLVSAWKITDRYSEDLDILALIFDADASTASRSRPLSRIPKWASEHIGVAKGDIRSEHMSNVGFRRSHLTIGERANYLKIDTTVEDYIDGLISICPVFSLMGRFATPEQIERHPELGGFEMPAVNPAYTAANKFDALHRRAAGEDYAGLVARGRDLYDLAAMAGSEHASDIRAEIPNLAERAAKTEGRRPPTPRPLGGYASSILFTEGSQAWHALKSGYERVEDLTWADLPPYENALQLAALLDG